MGWACELARTAWCTGVFQQSGRFIRRGVEVSKPAGSVGATPRRQLCWPENLQGLSTQVRRFRWDCTLCLPHKSSGVESDSFYQEPSNEICRNDWSAWLLFAGQHLRLEPRGLCKVPAHLIVESCLRQQQEGWSLYHKLLRHEISPCVCVCVCVCAHTHTGANLSLSMCGCVCVFESLMS